MWARVWPFFFFETTGSGLSLPKPNKTLDTPLRRPGFYRVADHTFGRNGDHRKDRRYLLDVSPEDSKPSAERSRLVAKTTSRTRKKSGAETAAANIEFSAQRIITTHVRITSLIVSQVNDSYQFRPTLVRVHLYSSACGAYESCRRGDDNHLSHASNEVHLLTIPAGPRGLGESANTRQQEKNKSNWLLRFSDTTSRPDDLHNHQLWPLWPWECDVVYAGRLLGYCNI
ncbi:hypothetical protein EDB84DRAFT_170730 [Lactarius hengduanensis]|nr:hypothetical protein EDB84DRAFT_170730 [Lactarius hengduanensis]